MTENASAQFKAEGQPAFPTEDTENDNSADSPSVDEEKETTTDQTQSDEGEQNSDGEQDDSDDQNFADHPRWKEREEDWTNRFNDQEKRHTDDMTKLREEFDEKYGKGTSDEEKKPDTLSESIPPWWNGDQAQWNEFKSWNDAQVAKAKEAAVGDIQAKNQAEQKAIDDATTYMNDQISEIQTDKTINPKGDKVDRNKLLKFVLDNDLVDSKGRWNYKAGWQLMQAGVTQAQTKTTDEKKRVAAATTSENRGETKPPAFMTSEDFEKPGAKPW